MIQPVTRVPKGVHDDRQAMNLGVSVAGNITFNKIFVE